MPWIDKVPAVLQAWYGGNESGNAIADIIYGRVNASGRLPITLPRRDEDVPAYTNFKSHQGLVSTAHQFLLMLICSGPLCRGSLCWLQMVPSKEN